MRGGGGTAELHQEIDALEEGWSRVQASGVGMRTGSSAVVAAAFAAGASAACGGAGRPGGGVAGLRHGTPAAGSGRGHAPSGPRGMGSVSSARRAAFSTGRESYGMYAMFVVMFLISQGLAADVLDQI